MSRKHENTRAFRRYTYSARGGQTQPSGYALSTGANGGIQCIIPAGSAVSDPDAGAIVWWPLLDQAGNHLTIGANGTIRDDFEYRVIAKELVTTTGSGIAWVAGVTTDTAINAAGILHGVSYAAANRAARAVRISGGTALTTDDASPSSAVNVYTYGNTSFNSPGFPSYYLTTLATSAGDPGSSGDNAGAFHNSAMTGALYAAICFYRAGTVAGNTTVEVDLRIMAEKFRAAEVFP